MIVIPLSPFTDEVKVMKSFTPSKEIAGQPLTAFLTSVAWDARLRVFPFECSERPLAYFFDSGIIIRGLLSLWRVTRFCAA